MNVHQLKAARAMLGLKQQELAKRAGLSIGTLNNIERGVQTDPKLSTMRALQEALENEGIEFTEYEAGDFGIRWRTNRNSRSVIPILIIDDNRIDRKLYRSWLSKKADTTFQITEASNAKEGYEAFLSSNPACIILDFMMYGKDGFQLLVEMKKDHAKIPPIIFVTATHNEAIRRDVLALGVHSYLDKKHLTRDKLFDAVTRAVL